MIVAEYYKTRADGVELYRTFSDKGMMIERDGVQYSAAIDPAGSGRVYTETDVPIETGEAEEADYQAVLREMGVEV